jgi:hypothetical protein
MLRYRIRQVEALLSRLAAASQRRAAPAARSLETAQDVIALLEEQIEAVRAEGWIGTLDKARAIGYLAGLARRAIETGQLAARLDMLETVLKDRKGECER